jgi:hypothetical protein
VLNVECDKCGRKGRYHLHGLIECYGIDAKLFDWSDEITADRPRKQAMNLGDLCGARYPDCAFARPGRLGIAACEPTLMKTLSPVSRRIPSSVPL